MRCVLAIDAGTTGVRAVVYGPDGDVQGAAYRELQMLYPRPGWAEQDAEELWRRTQAVVQGALNAANRSAADLAAVGVTNQRSSIVAWDSTTLEALSPLISWQDSRGAERCRELGEQGFFLTSNMACTKAEWILRHLDGARAAAAAARLCLGTPDSFLCAKLTGGCHATDPSNACTTGFYSHFQHTWDEALLAALSIDARMLPELVDSSASIGMTSAEAIGAQVPMAALCGDQQSSLFGLGCRTVGLTKCSYGTAAMVDANSGESITMGGGGTYPLVAWSIGGQPSYCVEGTVITAGAAVQWLRDGLGIVSDAQQTAELARSVPDTAGVWIVPAFQGLGTPYGLSQARAMVGGLSRGTTRAHLARAVLEAIAQRVTDVAESVWEACAAPAALRVDGGASANEVLLQIQADLLGRPVERSRVRDGAALGAAALASRAVGFWHEGEGALAWRPDATFEPRIDAAERERRRAIWKRRLALCAQESGDA